MSKTKYRVIAKVACSTCANNMLLRKPINTRCTQCSFVKYTAREGLINFTTFLNKQYPAWVWMNVYEYVKGEKGRKLTSYQKNKNEPTENFI